MAYSLWRIADKNRSRSIWNTGFTLIELLVVITIIAFILGIAVVNYRSANQRARNGKRTADLEQVRSSLEMYRADNPSIGYPNVANYAALSTPLANYLSLFPNDPQNASAGYTYYYIRPSTTTYRLCAYLEGVAPGACTGNPSCGGTPAVTCNYQVIQP